MCVKQDPYKLSVDMGVFQKKRRALSEAPDALSTHPQVPQITGEQKQGKTSTETQSLLDSAVA